jgi:hypothetical protein
MLSSIQGVLNEICELSNVRYSQGGLIYTYSYFHNTANSNLDKSLVNEINLTARDLDVNEVTLLSTLIEKAINDHSVEEISAKAKAYSLALVGVLNDSLSGNFTKVISNESDDSSQSIVIESIDCCNIGHKLTFFWSLD